ncbi:AraC family transcriptional regulator [Pseudoduganella flava]|uniref:AraC family transcriptional regulator n=1 Tax=Pseudoduganella flava TaxID=871742 RepID=A0A562Q0J1_9BURK|nr:AraC family transcriptional regulator [Pseudoduganella flava]QGZ38294.1 helix-turn-helix domain-containing protein [Pseudoduganella flava]TWI50168.1 AraC family transcriptional regulator [Pseudoduganella flava]
MPSRPACYPDRAAQLPLLDVLTSPVPEGLFPSPVDGRHVLCLHLGAPVPVTWRAERAEQHGVRLHGRFCVVPAGSSTRWTLSAPATSLLLRLAPALLDDAAEAMGLGAHRDVLAPSIHVQDAQVERIGWIMRAEEQDGHPGGSLFADSLAAALAARLLHLQSRREPEPATGNALPAWRLRQVIDYIDACLDQDLRLAELAAVAGYSVSHFKPLFRRAVGMPVHRFVLERRVQRAHALLAETTSSITAIALETGFAHASHMARCMRRLLGVAPAQLRRR